ncbi:hypothetical protein C488_19767 [Natrinema pellirubrum DSM 15624]|uniref:Uncharacterized protein n=3 Tax=Natrinema TaxID=88723 RepID=L9Y705_NATP1|nr:hypothetical protein C488_19767 [Natrinema pellirubrum DSM 15624]ELZ15794.1 hypothetical protein C478_04799 [Natrinema thermotolerans DSM 11552]QCC59017.1 hypothetical protein DVR14_10375 [Natrinema thermotolerans]
MPGVGLRSRMEDVVLHTGTEHPDLLWIVVPALLSFVAGLAIGLFAYADRIRAWLRPDGSTTD